MIGAVLDPKDFASDAVDVLFAAARDAIENKQANRNEVRDLAILARL